MILILTDIFEPTTDLVIDWLNYFGKKFVRISSRDPIYIKRIYFQDGKLEALLRAKVNDTYIWIDTAQVSSYWYRRSKFTATYEKIVSSCPSIDKILNAYHMDECKSAVLILYKILERKKHLNKLSDADDVCKVNILQLAKDAGLNIPDTLICTSKKELYPFFIRHGGSIITKPIGDPSVFFLNGIHAFTSLIENMDIIPDSFSLSLFQEKLEKDFELRIFYLNGTFYSSAIFSQNDPQTRIDFKNYNDDKPNRVVPFILPPKLERKLTELMHACDLNSGSIDVIYGGKSSKDYYFLEVNPVGQFEQVSIPCNYNLFKIIAEYL